MGSTALAAACALPRYSNLNFLWGTMKHRENSHLNQCLSVVFVLIYYAVHLSSFIFSCVVSLWCIFDWFVQCYMNHKTWLYKKVLVMCWCWRLLDSPKEGDIIGIFDQPDVGLGGVVSLYFLISYQQCHETTKVRGKCIRRPSSCLSFIMIWTECAF